MRLFLSCLLLLCPLLAQASRPNIVWIIVDDMSPHFSCYGEKTIQTPHVDALAKSGTLYRNAFTTAPICSIARSALLTGCYQISIGCHNHRAGTERFPIKLPQGLRPVTQTMREAGYHTNNLTVDAFLKDGGEVQIAKTDYNFVWDRAANYDTTHWTARDAGKPFFVQIQLHGGKHRGQRPGNKWQEKALLTLGSNTDIKAVQLPPYLPEDPLLREDWAHYLDTVRYTDWEVGRIVAKLKEKEVFENTVIIFWTDHGISHVRNKQFCYDGGLHTPLIMAGPGIAAGQVKEELVEHIDIAPTTLHLAGLSIPEAMQAKNLLEKAPSHREFVFAARDRADETEDRIRSVRSHGFKYIRNYFPNRPYLQPNNYKDSKAVVQVMRELHAQGKLNAAQSAILAETRPREEFYDLKTDPHELKNLANDPAFAKELIRHAQALDAWLKRTNDAGAKPESEEVYLDYVLDTRPEGGRNTQSPQFKANVELMRRWRSEKPMVE